MSTRSFRPLLLLLLAVVVQAQEREAPSEAQPRPSLDSSEQVATEARSDTTLALATQALRPFGLDLFNVLPAKVDTTIGAVDEFYPVGPGDEIVITIWGDLEESYRLLIDREGRIHVPRLGPLAISGVHLGELEGKITRFLASAYSSIPDEKSRIDVSLGELRTIQVFVVGEVKRPGIYYLSATSTILSALYQAGGILDGGSLRNISLNRHDQLISRFDFYNFILRGNKREDVRIQSGDVIRVPPTTKTVELQGQVYRPALYELHDNEGLQRLIEIAGGLKFEAYADRLQIERVVDHRERQVLDVDLNQTMASGETFPLNDGDKVSVYTVPEQILNSVTVHGFVKRPGLYQLLPGMRIKDLLIRSDGVFPEAYLGRADLLRTNPDLTRELIPLHLDRALDEDPVHNLVLEPFDDLTIHSIHTFGDPQFVSIHGEVRRPARYEFVDNMKLQDLVVMAGGLTDVAHRLEAEIARFDPGSGERPVEIVRSQVSDQYEIVAEAQNGLALRNRDAVFVRPNPEYEGNRFVTIEGEVRFPGRYALEGSERLSDLIARAGGLKERAYPEGARFQRRSRPGSGKLELVPLDLREALKRPSTGTEDLTLEDGDAIRIPVRPAAVRVTGEVFRRGNVLYREGAGVEYYLERAGGTTRNADEGRIFVLGANGQAMEASRFLWLWRRWPEVRAGSEIMVPASAPNN